jgi:hypothetical protein
MGGAKGKSGEGASKLTSLRKSTLCFVVSQKNVKQDCVAMTSI